MIFYPHFIGAYAADTKGLTPLEHGCYRLLLDHNYATEAPVPIDTKELYRIVGAMTPAERKAVDKVAERFFPVNGDGRRHNKRAEVEIVRAKEKSAKAKGSAAMRWQGERKADADAPAMRTHSVGNARQTQNQETSKASTADAVEGRDVVAAAPDCPHEKLVSLYHEVLPTCRQVVEWNEQRKALARARWREKAKAKPGYLTIEEGLAYWRRFFEYVARSKFLTGKADPGPSRAPFVATLEWLLRPKNFAKVVEGNYHEELVT